MAEEARLDPARVNTESKRYIYERTVPVSIAPRALCMGMNAGVADKIVDSNKKENRQAMGTAITQLVTFCHRACN